MTYYTNLQALLLLFICCSYSPSFAQPENDRCQNATLLQIGVDSTSCIPVRGDTRGAEDATLVEGPEVCSGSWYTDDVWFTIQTGNDIPENGITIEVRLDSAVNTELIEQGMAVYFDCEIGTEPINCFSNNAGVRRLQIFPNCIEPNSSFYIRIWSAPEPTDNSGTFSICAYEGSIDNEEEVAQPVIIYEEDFNNGLNGWVSEAVTETPGLYDGVIEPDDWIWTSSNCIPGFFENDCIITPENFCFPKGAVGFPSGWYVAGREMYNESIDYSPPYPLKKAYLISPSLDLSNETGQINLRWLESMIGLNGSEESELGPFIEFSIDGGKTWRYPSNAVGTGDVSIFYGGDYEVNRSQDIKQREIPLLGAEGNADVRIRFGFHGDFYYWLIDDVQLVEGQENELFVPEISVSSSHINPMSIHQIDTVDFVLDLFNPTINNFQNVKVIIQGKDTDGIISFMDSLIIPNLAADSKNNISFPTSFIPESEVEKYTFSYSITSETQILSHNIQDFSIDIVDEDEFRKEDGVATTTLEPDYYNTGWGADEDNFSWEIGNLFFVTDENEIPNFIGPIRADNISFQLDNYEELAGRSLRLWVYEIKDDNFDFIINKFDPNECKRINIAEYEIQGTETGFVTVRLEPFLTPSQVALKKNSHYLATVEYLYDENSYVYAKISAQESIHYESAHLNKRQNANGDLSKIRYANAFRVGTQDYFRIGPGEGLDAGNFDENIVPFIRLGYKPTYYVKTNELSLDKLQVSPSPASDFVNVSFELDKVSNVKFTLTNLEGKLMTTRSLSWNGNHTEKFDVSKYANGVYIVKIETEEGSVSKRLVVQK